MFQIVAQYQDAHERAYANSVINNDMDGITDIFDRWNGRDSFFF